MASVIVTSVVPESPASSVVQDTKLYYVQETVLRKKADTSVNVVVKTHFFPTAAFAEAGMDHIIALLQDSAPGSGSHLSHRGKHDKTWHSADKNHKVHFTLGPCKCFASPCLTTTALIVPDTTAS